MTKCKFGKNTIFGKFLDIYGTAVNYTSILMCCS